MRPPSGLAALKRTMANVIRSWEYTDAPLYRLHCPDKPVTPKITNYRKKSTEITEPKSQTLSDKITK